MVARRQHLHTTMSTNGSARSLLTVPLTSLRRPNFVWVQRCTPHYWRFRRPPKQRRRTRHRLIRMVPCRVNQNRHCGSFTSANLLALVLPSPKYPPPKTHTDHHRHQQHAAQTHLEHLVQLVLISLCLVADHGPQRRNRRQGLTFGKNAYEWTGFLCVLCGHVFVCLPVCMSMLSACVYLRVHVYSWM